ncbi:hypothetical protein M0802_016894 [Mischocyttarus mexicanus]|nr:hypothetical protein M0802_016894 [Mischocyttarus mexicanus]
MDDSKDFDCEDEKPLVAVRREGSSLRDINRHTCSRCSKSYIHAWHLKRHTKFECGQEPKIQCPYCAARMKQRGHVYRHIRQCHREILTRGRRQQLLQRQQQHHQQQQQQLQQQLQETQNCISSEKNELSRNRNNYPVMPIMKDLATLWLAKQRIEYPYRCEKCGKGYQHRATLLRHTRHECGKEPKFKCPYCPHRTKQRGNLYQHIRTNHPGKNVFSSNV